MPVESILSQLKEFNAPPSLLGFGISNPTQVKRAIEQGADGVISGSAVVKIIQENIGNHVQCIAELAEFVKSMKAATR